MTQRKWTMYIERFSFLYVQCPFVMCHQVSQSVPHQYHNFIVALLPHIYIKLFVRYFPLPILPPIHSVSVEFSKRSLFIMCLCCMNWLFWFKISIYIDSNAVYSIHSRCVCCLNAILRLEDWIQARNTLSTFSVNACIHSSIYIRSISNIYQCYS